MFNDVNGRSSLNQADDAEGRDPAVHETNNAQVTNYQKETTMLNEDCVSEKNYA